LSCSAPTTDLHSFPTRRSSDLANGDVRCNGNVIMNASTVNGNAIAAGTGVVRTITGTLTQHAAALPTPVLDASWWGPYYRNANRSEEHTSELQSLRHLVCRLLL